MKKLLLLCMTFALLVLAGGCGGERADEAHGAQLVYATKDYEEINVLVDEYAEIGQLLFDGLMRRDENDAIVPALAASVEYDPETYTYVFHLREGVHWHDGKPLRAADVKFTIEAIKNPLVASLHAPNFEEVRGGSRRADGAHPPVRTECGISRLHDAADSAGTSPCGTGSHNDGLLSQPRRNGPLSHGEMGGGQGDRSRKE